MVHPINYEKIRRGIVTSHKFLKFYFLMEVFFFLSYYITQNLKIFCCMLGGEATPSANFNYKK